MKEEDIKLEDIDETEEEEVEEEETITLGELINELIYYNETHVETYTIKEYLINVLNYSEESAQEISTYYNIFMNYS